MADRYRIERELGAGGMATVYLAHDLKHDRDVAIKVLHPDLGAALGSERFLTEIRTTARLQHPHILPLLDSGDADGLLYYVMPLVTGETLRARLERETQLPIDDAIAIAREVADALEYAHTLGVIHRDIKPENILLQNGHAVVADFGIALAVQQAGGQRMTQTGLSLGTPQYMSPEQAMGERTIDARSDIYALGAVLYEMLTGDPPFTGTSVQAVVAKVLSAEPERPSLVRKTIPPGVEAVVLTALAKLPADRFASAGGFASSLAHERLTLPASIASSSATNASTKWSPVTLAGWMVAAALAVALLWRVLAPPGTEAARSTRFAFSPGVITSSDVIGLEISPDGQRILFPRIQTPSGPSMVVRDVGSLETRTLAGISGDRPRVSPDGQWVAYRDGRTTRRVPMAGGTPTTISDQCTEFAVWLDDDSLLCTTADWGFARVAREGGPLEPLIGPDTSAGEIGLWSPGALPGGEAVVFTSYRRPAPRIEAFELRSRTRHVLVENAVMARYARSGHLLFVRDDALFAIKFDPKSLRTSGTAVPVLEDVESTPFNAVAGFAISNNGTLVAVRHSEWIAPRRMVWVDRQGVEQPGVTEPRDYDGPRISPDQSKIVVTVTTAGRRDLWLHDVRRNVLTQLTRSTSGGSAFGGIWSADGRQVLFTSETPAYDVFRIGIDGGAAAVRVFASVRDKFSPALSPDGANIVYDEDWAGVRRILIAPVSGSAPARSISDSSIYSLWPALSPDGRWVAYTEGRAASAQIIVARRVDGTGSKLQLSGGGGSAARWSKGGREVVFRRNNAVYAVDVDLASGHIGVEHRLFDGPYPSGPGYDVTADGSRFLMVRVDPRPEALPILVITNFFDELRKKVGR
jgi:eukaryotic-like serine/threonine-protein kinase